MPAVAALLCDVDGTLVDHDGGQRTALLEALVADGRPAGEAEWRRWRALEESIFPEFLAGRLGFWEQRRARVRGLLDEPLDDVAADAWYLAYQVRVEAEWTAYAEAVPVLDALAEAGVRLAAFSNVLGGLTRRKLTAVGLLDRFEVVLGVDEVAAPKPSAEPFVALCDWLDVPPARAAHAGDRCLQDAVAARDAGLLGVWVDRPEADPLGRAPTDGADLGGVWVVPDLTSLAARLLA